MPITSTVLRVAESDPGRPAIVGGAADGSGPAPRLDYAGLVEDSRRMFAAVDALHARQPDPPAPAAETGGIPITAVSVDSAFHTARIVAGLAGYRAVSATIDPRWPLAHRVGVIIATGIGVVISDDAELAGALAERDWGGTIAGLDEFRRLEAAAQPAQAPTVRDGDEAFLLLFSSGTTSDPKAFLKTRRQYRDNVAVSSAHLEPLPGVATLAPGPLSYSLTLYALIECLATGGEAHLADVFDPVAMAARVAEERITRVVAVPAVVQTLTDAARRDPSRFETLDLVVTGGANLPESLRLGLAEVLPGTRLVSYYGAAEIGFIGDSRGGDGTLIDVYPGIGASVRDAEGEEVADGEPGTLWISAAACSDGYVAGTTDAVLRGADGWATVGDQARMVDGRLQLLGRSGDIAVTGGHKVALPEVERAFDGMPGLGAVCAVALPHRRLGSVVALVLEAAGEEGEGSAAPPSKAELQRRARERLAPQFVPRRWYLIERLPRTVGGKIRRPATTEAVEAGSAVRL
ncbi:class I adenylate-forming enzyme family protein [Leucobacter ruminantium]|uniref:Long-chain fatty acid--CoA ligase n=1 Tax=Leucobacter ruminantium TaxID=1289170 RepID=A0A939M077_9MICO|nr:fatty acid--CoA ligase family protein [Leucobacter ruminantium]MBO1806328.1 long-chain fatty acid--CoA ligase [Leucobacter ruminantium]